MQHGQVQLVIVRKQCACPGKQWQNYQLINVILWVLCTRYKHFIGVVRGISVAVCR